LRSDAMVNSPCSAPMPSPATTPSARRPSAVDPPEQGSSHSNPCTASLPYVHSELEICTQ